MTQGTTLTILISNTLHLTSAVCEGINCFPFFLHKSFLFYRGALSQANKDEKGCLGPKECKYISLSPKKNTFSLNLEPPFVSPSASTEKYGLQIAI